MIETTKILIVDDEPAIRDSLSDILNAKGYSPLEAATGRQALEKIKEEMPVVALIDIKLGDMSGLDVMKRIKEISPGTECILITGHASRETAIEAINLGVYSYILKPYNVDQLLLTIQRAVEKQKMEKALSKSEALLSAAGRIAKIGGWEVDAKTLEVSWTKETYRIHETPLDYKPLLKDVINFFHPDDRSKLETAMQKTLAHGEPYDMKIRFITAKGKHLHVHTVCTPVIVDGNIVKLTGILQDITESETLHKQLIQAQKMESIGRLAGGVAHDYNNALSVIISFTELAVDDLDPKEQLYEDLNEVLTAARRAANITRQLLAFARKQTIAPRVLDLNENVEGMLKMLRRLIGEDIDLAWLPGAGLWPVKMDATQIDQILANLCVNARDAIEDVGKVTIETKNIIFDPPYCDGHPGFVPGEFVLLAVSDNGCGMVKEIRDNIFEPFFTTKDVNKGTGLGLATTYGIVKQNNGFINVYSEDGQGTAIKIYIPRQGPGIDKVREKSTMELLPGRGETILLVEDDLPVLKSTKKTLKSLGYTLLTAGTPKAAITLVKDSTQKIHLVVTDVIMPEMNGRELAEQLQSLRPDLKCMFMSGYTANAIAHHGVLDKGVHFIQKPFSKTDLAKTVRKVLDE